MDPTYTNFFDHKVLETEYFQRQRNAYEEHFQEGLIGRYRCYPVIVEKLQSIFEYNPRHARYFAKRIRTQQNCPRDCEAVVSEVIVYSEYLPLVKQGIVKSLDRCEDDYDLKIERAGYPDVFLEVFCIMPEFKKNERGVYDVKSHLQTEVASVRQKLLLKMRKQKQMQQARENWAVIELNDASIAGDFTVPSSLSDGYKLVISRETTKVERRGYDWSASVFDAPETQNLHGVIHFDLGYYEGRRYILNDRVRGETEKPTVP